MSGQVLLAIEGGVARVTLSHPGKLNAMSRAMWGSLTEVFTGLQLRADIGCVVLCGEAGNFCAGGDISEYPGFRFEETSLRDFHENDVWGCLQAMLNCDIAVVAQIEGACMGAGIELACCCDMRLASVSALFGAPIAKLGFPMAPREAELVWRVAGALTTREMLLSGAVLDAPTLLQRGFLNHVLQDHELAAQSSALAARVNRLAPEAARQNKQSLRRLAQVDCAKIAPDLIANAYAYANSAEHREGVSAFMEKRQPRFSGAADR